MEAKKIADLNRAFGQQYSHITTRTNDKLENRRFFRELVCAMLASPVSDSMKNKIGKASYAYEIALEREKELGL